jgi:hypothetical protein
LVAAFKREKIMEDMQLTAGEYEGLLGRIGVKGVGKTPGEGVMRERLVIKVPARVGRVGDEEVEVIRGVEKGKQKAVEVVDVDEKDAARERMEVDDEVWSVRSSVVERMVEELEGEQDEVERLRWELRGARKVEEEQRREIAALEDVVKGMDCIFLFFYFFCYLILF